MTWHVIAQQGRTDTFAPQLPADVPRILVPIDRTGDPWRVSTNVSELIATTFGAPLVGVNADLVRLATVVFTADLRIRRYLADDRWTRALKLYVPVSNPSLWEKVTPVLKEALSFLTGDEWSFEWRALSKAEPKPRKLKKPKVDKVVLFSGGLDSLVGAIDLLAAGDRVALVSHHGKGIAKTFQDTLVAALSERFKGQVEPLLFYVQPPKNPRTRQPAGSSGRKKKSEGEPSMRSRSFLFLALGIAVAEFVGERTALTVAENGLISLNVPLTETRVGSLSTRTTHPHFMALCRKLVKRLGLTTRIELPYKFMTKGEMLKATSDPAVLAGMAKDTMSCSHPETGRYRDGKIDQHCGYCVPCIIRGASMRAAGVPDKPYMVDVRRNPPSAETATGSDLRAFQIALARFSSLDESSALFEVLGTGPLPPKDAAGYAAMFQRGLKEVAAYMADGG